MTPAPLFASLATALAVAGSALAQTPPPPSPRDYAQAAAQSDAYEIEAGYTARTESQDPRVRAFADMMIRDHTRTTESLRAAARSAGLPPPSSGVGGDQKEMLSALQSLRGRDFDREYARQQVLAHAQALTVTGLYAQGGASGPLRQAAEGALPIIQGHADQARRLQADLGGT